MNVPESMLRERAGDLVKGLMWFALVKSTDPEKQKGLERLKDLCTEVMEILDILVPGWAE